MWQLSQDYATAKAVNRGYRASALNVEYKEVRNTVLNAARERQYQMLSQIETLCKGADKERSVTFMKGWAEFVDKNTVRVKKPDGDNEEIYGDYFILCTGSYPRQLPEIPIDTKMIIDSNHILKLKKFPKRMLIIGAGIVGCEYATMFANFGKTEVHLLDRQNRVIPFEDDDISNFVEKNLEKIGVIVHHDANLREIRKHPQKIDIVLDYHSGKTEFFDVDLILISAGRIPNTIHLGLDKIGVNVNPNMTVTTDYNCKIVDNIYAAGDISGNAALINIAEMEGRFAAKAISGKVLHKLYYNNLSTIMFFNPEVASVGLNEKQCKEKKLAYRMAYLSNCLNGRSIAMRNINGFVKIIISNDDDPIILGMRAAGPQASATIMCLAYQIDMKVPIRQVLKIIHPHPSITESIQECLRSLLNKGIYKKEAFPEYIKIYSWEP